VDKKTQQKYRLLLRGWKEIFYEFPPLNIELELLDWNENSAVAIFSQQFNEVLEVKIIYSGSDFNSQKIRYWRKRKERTYDAAAYATIPRGKN